jgi:hypothetical protein
MPEQEHELEGDGDLGDQQTDEQGDVQIQTEWQIRHREDGGEKR